MSKKKAELAREAKWAKDAAKTAANPPSIWFVLGEPADPSPAGTTVEAYDVHVTVRHMLTPSNTRYLDVDRVWPVRASDRATLAHDATLATWTLSHAHVDPPLMLAEVATWQRFLDVGLRVKPKTKRERSVLYWPIALGHTAIVALLLSRFRAENADVNHGEPLVNAASAGHEAIARLLAEHGADVEASLNAMRRFNDDRAMAILAALRR
ncbi:MAG: ankyrin repeat domain-containing protein [Kofleriaceae bacterium]